MHLFYATGRHVHYSLTKITWLLLALWFDIRHTNTHTARTGANRLTNKYILTPHILFTVAISLTDMKSLLYGGSQYLCCNIFFLPTRWKIWHTNISIPLSSLDLSAGNWDSLTSLWNLHLNFDLTDHVTFNYYSRCIVYTL